jgi:hypothetical protein
VPGRGRIVVAARRLERRYIQKQYVSSGRKDGVASRWRIFEAMSDDPDFE